MKTPEAYPLGYVEDFSEVRTKLAGVFSSRYICSMSAIIVCSPLAPAGCGRTISAICS